MARTRKSIQPLNLYKYDVLIEDQGPRSDYFKISQFDGYFYGGRNAFLLAGAGILKPNTSILVEILNVNGNTVYSVPVTNFTEGNSRLIQTEVYSDTPIGPGKLVILGCADTYIDGTPVPDIWKNKYNVRWITDIIISPLVRNKTPIRFEKEPSIVVEEKFYKAPESATFTEKIYVPVDVELTPKYFNIFPNGYQIRLTGPGNTRYFSDYSNGIITGSAMISPSNEYATIELPITKILNSTRAESDGRLIYTDKNTLLLGGFLSNSGAYNTTLLPFGSTTVSGSMQLVYSKLDTVSTGSDISFAKIRIVDTKTLSGEINKVRVSYKESTRPGEYVTLSDVDVGVTELFAVDSGSKIVSTGQFKDLLINDYWYTATMSLQKTDAIPQPPIYFNSSSLITSNSIITQCCVDLLDSINATPLISASTYLNNVSYFIGNRTENSLTLFPRTEYTLAFDAFITKTSASLEVDQTDYSMEVYLVQQENSTGVVLTADKRGQLIGTLTPKTGFLRQNFETVEFNFTPQILSTGEFGLRFVVYGGYWNIANVSVKTAQEPYFSPDEIDILIPIVNYQNTILQFRAEYLDINNNTAGTTTISTPLYVTGSDKYAVNGFPYTGSAMISGSLGITGSLTITGSGTLINIGPARFTGSVSTTDNLLVNGNVGIGTVTPQGKLHVVTGSLVNAHYNNQGAFLFEAQEAQMQVISDDSGNHASKFVLSTVSSSTVNKHWMLDQKGPGLGNRFDISYFTSSNSGNILAPSGVEKLTITTNGHVGIGTTTPTATLHVQGTISSSGNVTVDGNLTVSGLVTAASQSITYISSSQLNVGTNIITVNVQNPTVQFGGLAVIDSGSSPQRSGSLLFDSINDQWIFVHQNQTSPTSSVLLMGPQTYNNIGNETNLTNNYLLKSVNAEHVGDSQIYDNGTNVGIGTSSPVGKLTVNGYTGGTVGSAIAAHQKNVVIGGAYNQLYNTSASVMFLIADYSNDTTDDVYPIYVEDENNVVDFFLHAGNDQTTATKRAYFGGKVGIGTTSPSYSLELGGATANIRIAPSTLTNNALIRYANNAGNAYVGLDNSSGGLGGAYTLNMWHAGAYSIVFGTNNTTRAVIDSSGNVGIGTTSPSYPLQVRRAGGAGSLGITIDNVFSASDRTTKYLAVADSTSDTTGHVFYVRNGTATDVAVLSLRYDGNVGIGTTSPAQKLQVIGNAIIGANSNSSVAARLDITAGGNGYDSVIDFGYYDTFDAGIWNIGRKGSTGAFFISNYGSGTEANVVTINASNNVGIGTTSPSYKLDVSGTIGLSGFPFAVKSGNYNQIYEPAGNTAIYLGNATDPTNYYDNSVHQWRNRGGGTDYMRLNSVGNVGIGTTNPLHRLQLSTAASIAIPPAYSQVPSSWTRDAGGIILAGSETSDGSSGWRYGSRIMTKDYGDGLGVSWDVLYNGTWTNDALFVGGRSGKLGYVGIGSTNPLTPLYVVGNIQTTTGVIASTFWTNTDIRKLNASTAMNFRDSAGNIEMIIDGSGRVGIGTTSPSYKLDVNGGVRLADGGSRPTVIETGGMIYSQGNTGGWAFGHHIKGSSGTDRGGFGFYGGVNALTYYYIGQDYLSPTMVIQSGSSGNVGIGTISPSTKLHVYTGTTSNIAILEGSAGQYLQGGTDGGGFYLEQVGTTSGNRILRIQNSNGSGTYTQLFLHGANQTIYTSANVNFGIGTSSPSYKLDIAGAGSGNVAVRLTPDTGIIRLYGYDLLGYSNGTLWTISNTTYNEFVLGTSWDWDRSMSFKYTPGTTGAATGELIIGQQSKNDANWTHGIINLQTNGTTRMYINSSGKVGIATTSPQSTLHVAGTVGYGTIRITPTSANGESAMAFFTDVAGTDTNDAWVVGHAGWGHTGDFVIGNENNGAGGDVRLLIEKSGNVGIGTTSPGEKLEVNGNIKTQGYVIFKDTNNSNTYGLRGLSGVITLDGGAQYPTAWNFQYGNSSNSGMYISSSGYVGIGTTSPGVKLDVSGVIRSPSLIDSDSTRIVNPGGAYYVSSAGTEVGAFKIKLPVAKNNSSTMMRMTVQIYQYSTGTSHTFLIGGYNYGGGGWYNVFATNITDIGGNYTVRFGYDGTSDCIWIGETNSSWYYPQVFVTDFQMGYNAYDTSWATGWTITRVTSFDTVETSRTAAYVWTNNNDGAGSGLDADLLDGYSSATSATGNTIALRDANGDLTNRYNFASYNNTSDDVSSGTITYIMAKFGDNYHRSATAAKVAAFISGQSMNIAGNASTATTAVNLSTDRTNWSTNGTISAVVGQLAWKNYGNGHTIIDASAGTAPNGTAINNTNSTYAWTGNYPTLMGWNGSDTYGVRVDSARVADTAGNITAYTINQNVGSGNTPTFAGLYISTGNTSAAYQYFSNNGGQFYIGKENSAGSAFGVDAYANILYTSNTYPMIFLINGSEKMRLTNTGRLGIGNTSPSFTLDASDNTVRTGRIYRSFQSYTGTTNNLVRTWDGVLVAGSDSGGAETYTIIDTGVPQDSYMMGGFTIDWFEDYGSTNAKTQIKLGGYWNAESNGGFQGWEYTSTNPDIRPTIQIARNSSTGNTAFILSHFGASYAIIMARDLWLGYNSGAETYGSGWTIQQVSSTSGYTNFDTVVPRIAPSPTGTGASGTWGISISGNAANITAYTINQSVGTGNSPTFAGLTINGSNSAKIALVAGSSKGVRLGADGSYGYVEAVDNTGVASYQPMYFGGSVINFAIAGSIKAYMDASGNLGIGTTSPAAKLHVVGDIVATGNITAYYSSDRRLKKNISLLTNALDKLSKISGVEFDWTDEYIKTHGGEDGYFIRRHDVGVIAQEIQDVLPEVVAEKIDGYLGVRYEKVVPLLIQAIKEQQLQIEELKKTISKLDVI